MLIDDHTVAAVAQRLGLSGSQRPLNRKAQRPRAWGPGGALAGRLYDAVRRGIAARRTRHLKRSVGHFQAQRLAGRSTRSDVQKRGTDGPDAEFRPAEQGSAKKLRGIFLCLSSRL